MGYLIASATFAEDIGVPVEPINVGSRAAMPSEGKASPSCRLQRMCRRFAMQCRLKFLKARQAAMFEAADLYRELLSERPDLVYPRFDLGVMLFEDKQYREALVQLHRAEEVLPPDYAAACTGIYPSGGSGAGVASFVQYEL